MWLSGIGFHREIAAVRILAVAAQRRQIGELRRRIQIRTARDEEPDGVEAIVRDGEDQWRLEPIVFSRVDIRASVEKRRDRAGVARGGREHQRRRAGARLRVDDGAGADERFHDRRRSALGREMERGVRAEPRSHAGAGTRCNAIHRADDG